MKSLLSAAALAEIATGAALLLVPVLVCEMLLGAEASGTAVIVARVTGIALVSLGIACWPGPPMSGMLVYSAAITAYLAYVGLAGEANGMLLWPVVVLHAAMTALLGWSWVGARRAAPSQ